MIPDRSTPVPNIIFDYYLPILKPAELAVLLVVIRQTLGWKDGKNGRRKYNDWISGSQLRVKTGFSRKAISTAIEGLARHRLIRVTDEYGKLLQSAEERQGKLRLLFAFSGENPVQMLSKLKYKEPNPCVLNATNMRTYYAQQKKLLQKKMTLQQP